MLNKKGAKFSLIFMQVFCFWAPLIEERNKPFRLKNSAKFCCYNWGKNSCLKLNEFSRQNGSFFSSKRRCSEKKRIGYLYMSYPLILLHNRYRKEDSQSQNNTNSNTTGTTTTTSVSVPKCIVIDDEPHEPVYSVSSTLLNESSSLGKSFVVSIFFYC